MILAFPSTKKAQNDLAAAMHPFDKTIRPQVVSRNFNPSYHKILTKFHQKTGRAGFLNTSFNLHGEPIVCGPADAIHTLLNSKLEYLALENFLISKNKG